jgi:hypothetical protein
VGASCKIMEKHIQVKQKVVDCFMKSEMACKLNSPVYCDECDLYDNPDFYKCINGHVPGGYFCEMYERYNYPLDFIDKPDPTCNCCYACHYTEILRVKEKTDWEEIFEDADSLKAHIECAGCKCLVYFKYDNYDRPFFSLQDVHEAAKWSMKARLGLIFH